MIDGEDFFQELKIIAIKKLEENKVDFVEEEDEKKILEKQLVNIFIKIAS